MFVGSVFSSCFAFFLEPCFKTASKNKLLGELDALVLLLYHVKHRLIISSVLLGSDSSNVHKSQKERDC